MTETIHINAPGLAGETGLTAYVRRRDTGALLNGIGDSLSEPYSGHFTFTLAESRVGLGLLRVDISDTGDPDDIAVYCYLSEDDTVCQEVDIVPSIDFTSAQLAALTVETGVISNFPDELIIGDSYSVDTGKQLKMSQGIEIELVRAYDDKLVVKSENDYYNLTGDNYIYFNWWFQKID
jgi:hypothetical protein